MPTPEASLPHRFRKERLRRKTKQPFHSSLFVRISVIVEKYGLGEDFLDKLDEFTHNFSPEPRKGDAVMGKKDLRLPLFYLAPPERYRLTMAIIERITNPYLNFVHSPDEILLCNPLFRHNPDLDPERLAAGHFQTLLWGDPGR